MRSIIVVKREGKIISDKSEWIGIEDINFTEPERIRGEIRTVIHTDEGEFLYCTTNDQVIELLSQEHGFMITDRGRMANLKKEIDIDYDNRNILYLKCMKYITIAASKVNSLKQLLKRISK